MPAYQALGEMYQVTLTPLVSPELELEALTAPASAKPVGRAMLFAKRFGAPAESRSLRSPVASKIATGLSVDAIARTVSESPVLRSRIADPSRLAVVQGAVTAPAYAGRKPVGQVPISTPATLTLATETVIAEGLRQADLAAAKAFGAEVVDEGLDGKTLLRVQSVDRVFGLVDLLLKREVGSVTPNFLRHIVRVRQSAPAAAWSLAKIGAADAWRVTRGRPEIKVAVLDEGVDTTHPALKPAVVAERDFIGGKGNSAMPDGNDAHGTACAGIVLSRDKTYAGIAPGCSLIAARIAMDDGTGHNWIFDDYSTADAIDWAWREGAAVLSNSWGGGAPSDAISRAFARARTQGRNGLGAVVVIAAGNLETATVFPGNLPGYVTVGASNPADERKTHTSSDGEDWWGSNFGATMLLLAPGVFIWTTDIVGPAGYDPGDFTKTFNGTSSATPAVAGAAALMLSANPALSVASVRDLLAQTADPIQGQTTWTPELGWGRLNVAKAVPAAQSAGTGKTQRKTKTTKAVKTRKTAKTTKTAKAKKTAKAAKKAKKSARKQQHKKR